MRRLGAIAAGLVALASTAGATLHGSVDAGGGNEEIDASRLSTPLPATPGPAPTCSSPAPATTRSRRSPTM